MAFATEEASAQDTLLQCLRFDGSVCDEARLSTLNEAAWERLTRLALRTGVAPLWYHALRFQSARRAVPPDSLRTLKEAYLGTAARNQRCYHELQALLAALQAAEIPVIVLKGAFLAANVYDNPAVRPMSDIDLLVPLDRLEQAGALLTALGYRPARPLDTDVVLEVVQHLPLSLRRDAAGAIEIHWGLTPPKRTYSVDVAEFWERCVPTSIAGRELLALCPEDLLLHLSVHAAYMHEFACGLRPFCDLAATIRHYGNSLAWDALTARAIRLGWRRGVYLALRLAQEWLGAAVPAEALDALQPDDFDPAFCVAARDQVFSEVAEQEETTPSTPFTILWGRGRFRDKARVLHSRLFPNRPTLARRYSVRPDSPAIYMAYVRLWIDLTARYGPITGRLLRGEAPMAQFVRSRERLGQWMAQPSAPTPENRGGGTPA